MDEQVTSQIADTAARMAAAAEAMEHALGRLLAQQEAIEQKVERIVAAIDEHGGPTGSSITPGEPAGSERVTQLERENQELKAQVQHSMRKTLPPVVAALLTKSGYEETEVRVDAAMLDKTLGSLSLEQRIAVKAEMARAGLIE